MDHRWDFGSADRMVSAWRRITYRKSNFNGCAGNGDCVYRNFTSGSNYQYSERAGNVRAHFWRSIWFQSNFRSIFRFGHDAGNPPGTLFQWGRYRFRSECISFGKCQPSGKTGAGTDVIRIYWYFVALYSNSNDVYVIRDRSGKRIAGSTMGAGISSGITWFFRADLYYSCNGIFCIYNSARELFLLWQSFNLHSQKTAGKSFYERLQTGIGTCNLSGRRNGDVSFVGSFRCTDGGYGAH